MLKIEIRRCIVRKDPNNPDVYRGTIETVSRESLKEQFEQPEVTFENPIWTFD